MSKKTWLLIFVALALAAAYVINFTNWFTPKVIHIMCTNERSTRIRRGGNLDADSTTVPVIFKLGRPYKLTEIKVVALAEWQTNKDCLPLWHLIAGTNTVPIEQPFYYGDYIRGRGRPDNYIQRYAARSAGRTRPTASTRRQISHLRHGRFGKRRT